MPNFVLNNDLLDHQGIDLNMHPDPQEMIVDPVFPVPHNQSGNDVFLNQVNEEEEDNQLDLNNIVEAHEVIVPIDVPPLVEVNIPVINAQRTFFLLKSKKTTSWQRRKSNSSWKRRMHSKLLLAHRT